MQNYWLHNISNKPDVFIKVLNKGYLPIGFLCLIHKDFIDKTFKEF